MSTQRSAINARIDKRVAESIGQRKYELWIQPSVRLDYEDAAHTLHVAVPNRFVADKIRSDFSDELREAVRVEAGMAAADELQMDLCIAPDRFAAPTPPNQPRPSADDLEDVHRAKRGNPRNPRNSRNARPDGHPLNFSPPPGGTRQTRNPAAQDPALAGPLRHRFEDFVIGPANELACAAAVSLVESEAEDPNNPAIAPGGGLFVHGECGMGKTHLLQAACRRMLDRRPDARVLYTTGEQFTNAYITAVRTGKLDAFRRSMRRLDLLAVDDIEFLANKDKTQQEFLHSFSHIELSGSRVILASDSHPKLIKRFSEGLVSRCVQGLVVQIQAPDQPTRLALVNRLAKRRGLVLQPGLDERVAAIAGRSVRELEGTLAHLHALASLSQPQGPTRMVNRALVEKLVAGQSQLRAQRPVRFDDIRDTVCGHLNVPAAQVAGSSRHRLVVLARATLIHLTRQMTTLSFPEIAAALGKPSHSTVVTASQRMSRQLEDNRPLLLPGFTEPMTPVQLVEDLRRQVLQNLSAA